MAPNIPQARAAHRTGIVYGVVAYIIWGLLPAFIKLLKPLPATDILAHRVLWSLLLLAILAAALRRGPALQRIFAAPRLLLALSASAALIAVNWLCYIGAVNSGQVAQASLGYFINPIVNVALGVIVLRERLGRVEAVAVGLAALGVAFLAWEQGSVPVVPLTIAFSFALYGLIRKMTPVESIDGLLVETVILAGPAAVYLALAGTSIAAISLEGGPAWILLPGAGLLTATPFMLFAAAARVVRYSDLGLMQYLAPTLQLLLAVAVYGERLRAIEWAAFALIWIALAIYAVGLVRTNRTAPVIVPD